MGDMISVRDVVWEGNALLGRWATQLDGQAVELWYEGVWRWRIGHQYGVLRGYDHTRQGTVLAMETLIDRWASQEL